ncbi:MAG: FHA domain-containing protein [bacterium]
MKPGKILSAFGGANNPRARAPRVLLFAIVPVALVALAAPAALSAAAVGGLRLASGEAGAGPLWWGLGALGITFPLLFWLFSRTRAVNEAETPGFEVITASEKRNFIPLEEKFQQMDFLNGVAKGSSLRLSANLNKVNLSYRRFGYLLEDKNFRNALLVNRRRVRRTMLRDGDVLDLGDLTLLYRDKRRPALARKAVVTPPEGKVQIKFDRVRGPVRKGIPMLTSEQHPNRVFYLTKNMIYLGRSETNDVIIKSRNVDFRHAKIERVGSHYKFINLSHSGNSLVNNRRVEQRVLRDGDELAVDNQRFTFQLVSKPVRETPGPSSIQQPPEEAGEAAAPDEERQGAETSAFPDGSE